MKLMWRAVYPFLLRAALITGMEDADLDCSDTNERSVASSPNDVTQDSGNLTELQILVTKLEESMECECGLSFDDDKAEERIINGEPVPLGKYPWMVKIDHPVADCTGSIVAPNKVITAAHCILSPEKSAKEFGNCIIPLTVGGKPYCDMSPNATVVFSNETSSETSVRVKRANFSENYPAQGCKLDIAVLTVEELPCSNFTRPICLPSKDPVETGASVTIAGWGSFLPGGKPSENGPNILRDGFLKITNKSQSEHCFGATGINHTVCFGDSGGPAFLREKDGTFVQIGVISTSGSLDCRPETESQFQNLYYRLKWVIKHVMKS